MKLLQFIFILTVLSAIKCEEEFENTPVVLWHGMGKELQFGSSLESLKSANSFV